MVGSGGELVLSLACILVTGLSKVPQIQSLARWSEGREGGWVGLPVLGHVPGYVP